MKLRIKKLHHNARLPEYATEGAACFDLYAVTVNGSELIGASCKPGCPVITGTGLAFEVPDGYMLDIRPRSGLAFKYGVQAFHGTIDSDYRGQVMIRMDSMDLAVMIKPGDRVAQAAIVPTPRVVFEVCEQLTLTERGIGGFGHSGV